MSEGLAPGAWRPGADHGVLALRACLLSRIREFFGERGVLEVETPILARSATTDPGLASLRTRFTGPGSADGRLLYLRTSPELEMKRLIASGSGPIYQISRAFRDGEHGARHNPEFTLLEWYRPGFELADIMRESAALAAALVAETRETLPVEELSYREAFLRHLEIDPLTATVDTLRRCAERHDVPVPPRMPADTADPWLDLLVSVCVEPNLGRDRLTLLHHYPASQAALARLSPEDPRTAERFELFVDGVELANGFRELTDGEEQRLRLEAENAARRRRGLAEMPVDERFLSALSHGLPDCSGVALGFDRLVMVAAGARDIGAVMAFAFDRA